MSVTSIRLSPELGLIKDSTDVPFSKRINVIAERYMHLINTSGCDNLTSDQMEMLASIPKILTMRGSMIEHLPRVILESKLVYPRHELARCAKAVSDMSVLDRMILIERLEMHDY